MGSIRNTRLWAVCFRLFGALLLAVSLLAHAEASLGKRVTNVAEYSYTNDSGTTVRVRTNPAEFTIVAAPTPSTVEFFRFAPTAPDALVTRINGSQFSPDGSKAGPFVDFPAPSTLNGVELDFSGDVPIIPAETYLAGELLIVRVIDTGQNGNPNVIETVTVEITCDDIDVITIRLFESGPNTGEFFAYVPTTPDVTPRNDNVLSTPNQASLTATYIDVFDETEVSIDTALVDPFGFLFDSLTGERIDGATVTIVDARSGAPAPVFGIDGFSEYPSTVVTGSVVTDESGLQYPLDAGGFLFPLMFPGEYRLLIEPPDGYTFPSTATEAEIAALPNGPFEIIEGSFGAFFTVEATGPLNFDVPLDPSGDLVVTKQAGIATASVGDYVGYTISIQNRDDVAARIRIEDQVPAGFRYQPGTSRLSGSRIADPEILSDGETLIFDTRQALGPGESVNLTYVLAVGAGTPLGEAVNRAVAVDGTGLAISNAAEAAISIQEDLLRSRLTIVGRVAEDACDADDEWARELRDGTGVGGVRLYMEDGQYVVTDREGKFHFENVLPGTHVVQVDEATLPPGYEPMICEENSRYAGSAISQFVDARGGVIWRANFYLKRTEAALEAEEEALNEVVTYDEAWLNSQPDGRYFAYPSEGTTPAARAIDVGIVHETGTTIRLFVNDRAVHAATYQGAIRSSDDQRKLSRWQAVNILDGNNRVRAEFVSTDGTIVETLEQTVSYVTEIHRVELVDDQSVLAADGRTPPSIALRVTDNAGRPVHAGRLITVNVESPYRLFDARRFEAEAPVTTAFTNLTGTAVDEYGVAHVLLDPTLETGRVRLRVLMNGNREEEIDVYLRPEKRDWILVGLAEGEAGIRTIDPSSAQSATDLITDGRVAFFAKGVVKGDWLLTIAADSDRRRGDIDDALFTDIDPNAFYTLYGDRSYQDGDADSQYPVYVKLEKNTFFALFGDYNTGLNESRLSRYNRRLSGLHSVYEGEHFSFEAFAAETNQQFARAELAADGTSGPFRIPGAPLVRNSEIITIETRDRFRPDQIIRQVNLARFTDYDIDFTTGELIFRTPVDVTDEGLNPNVIVVTYETINRGERNITAGGRAEARLLDERVELGATYVREEGSRTTANATSQLIGVDATVHVDEFTEINAEFATTQSSGGAPGAQQAGEGDAYLLEIIRRQERYSVSAFYRREEPGFGLGQLSTGTNGFERLGAQVSVNLATVQKKDGLRIDHVADAQAIREKSLTTGSERDLYEVNYTRRAGTFSTQLGLRAVNEDLVTETLDGTEAIESRQSLLLTGGVQKRFEKVGLGVSLVHEQPLGRDKDEVTQFPQRTVIGVDKSITARAILSVRHEILDGENASGQNTIAGLTVQPWSGGQINLSADTITADSGRRVGATVGVDQTFRINERWSAGFGIAHREQIDGDSDENPVDPLADAPRSPLETAPQSPLTLTEGFTSAYVGAGYQSDKTAASARIEARNSADGERYLALIGAARESSETLSFAVASRLQRELLDEAANRTDIDTRVGVSWRPVGEGTIVYNRFDVIHSDIEGEQTNLRLVNNLGVNTYLTDRTQAAVFYGFKYSQTQIGEDQFSGFTHLVGGEIRHDITRRIDLGFQGAALIDQNTGTTDYAFGPSVGFTPAENTWISLGYNFEGISDRDFQDAEFLQSGPYIKLRVKFDQNTVKGLLDRITPGARYQAE